MQLADRIRAHVIEQFILPARKAHRSTILLVGKEIHDEMELENRMPAVCGALDTKKFEALANITVTQRTGPAQGATAEWVIQL